MGFDRAQLKQSVKLSMKGASPNPVLVSMLFTVVLSVGTWLINTILGRLLTGGMGNISDTVMIYMQQGYEVQEALYIALLELFRRGPGALFGVIVGGTVLSVIVKLWESTMGVGFMDYCLSMVRNEDPPMGKIFSALPMLGQVLVTRVLTGVFALLWSLLVVVGYAVILVAATLIDIPLITGLLIIADVAALILGIIWVTMRYVLVDFVLVDKGLSGLDAIRESKRLMQGNIGKGFVLELSFLGWGVLLMTIIYGGILIPAGIVLSQLTSAGGLIAASAVAMLIFAVAAIGATVLILWMRPYINGCWAKFYDWARGEADGFGGDPSYGGGSGGWGEHTDYTWSSGGDFRGTGMGPGPGNGPSTRNPPKPRDDPWN